LDSYLTLYQSDGTFVASNDDRFLDPGSSSSLDSFLEHLFTTPGTYVLQVRGYGSTVVPSGATYTLHVSLENAVGAGALDVIQVTIPAGSASVTIDLAPVQDFLIDGNQTARVAAFASGHASGEATVTVADSAVRQTLTLDIPTTIVDEGDTISGTVTRNGDTTSDLTVYLFSHDASEVSLPMSVVIPAGQTTAAFAVLGVEDNVIDGVQLVAVSAYAPGYSAAQQDVTVVDSGNGGLSSLLSVGPRRNVSDLAVPEAGHESSVSIAIDPTNTQHIAILSNRDAGQDLRLYRSTNGGTTWTRTVIAVADGVSGTDRFDPSIAFDANGNLYYSYVVLDTVGAYHVMLGKRTPGGALSYREIELSTLPLEKPQVVTGPDPVTPGQENVYVTYLVQTGTETQLALTNKFVLP